MRFWILLTLAAPLTLAGCETAKGLFGGPAEVTVVSPDMPVLKPKPRPGSVQEVPVVLPVSGDQTLGTTIAALGDPAIPGLWMETPLTNKEQTGTARYGDTTVALTLKPTGGAAGSGSRLSLLAMQALGAPLTELVEITVVGAR